VPNVFDADNDVDVLRSQFQLNGNAIVGTPEGELLEHRGLRLRSGLSVCTYEMELKIP